jgi:hypothetical protein
MNIEWTRIKSDINGNPRYVCHFLNLLTDEELGRTGDGWIPISQKYAIATKRANQIGGRKYHCKAYGGGIVFQSYSLDELEAAIAKLTGRNEGVA